MQAKHFSRAGCVLLALTAGCSHSGNTPPEQAGDQPGPEKVVAEFMDALRKGEKLKAASLLTPVARQKTAEAKLEVGLPASPSASFEVGEVELLADDAAHVASTWTDLEQGGGGGPDKIVWILRKETEGWRVAGMATKIFEDELPLILNFEDPADMIRKQQLADEELTRRAEEEKSQAGREKKDFK